MRERPARAAYGTLQETIYANQCDLSVYRLKLDVGWVVVGVPPEERLDAQVRETLAVGESISLPGTSWVPSWPGGVRRTGRGLGSKGI